MKIKCRLKVVLAELGMNQGDFAKVMGVSPATVSSWVKGTSYPTLPMIYEIEKVTGFDLKQIWVEELN